MPPSTNFPYTTLWSSSVTTTPRAKRPAKGESCKVAPKSSPKEERKAEPATTLSKPSAAQKRSRAKGRSLEIDKTTVLSKELAFSLKLRVCAWQTPVSMDGNSDRTRRLPA